MNVTGADFRSSAPPARIIGSEMEVNIEAVQEGVEPRELLKHIYKTGGAELGINTGLGVNGMLENGAKLYCDGKYIEYATQECTDGEDVTLAEAAGRKKIVALVTASQVDHSGIFDRAASVDYQQPKNPDATNGYHGNFSIPNDPQVIARLKRFFPTFLASSVIWSGSGYMSRAGFRISQKASGIGKLFLENPADRTSPGAKPMINITSQDCCARPAANQDDFRRCEVRMIDPNRSWYIRPQVFDVSSLCLRLFEQCSDDELEKLPELPKPDAALRLISKDMTLSALYRLCSGGRARAADIQLTYARAIMDMLQKTTLPARDYRAGETFYELATELAAVEGEDVFDALKDRLDWVARAAIIRKHLGDKALRRLSPRAAYLDTAWDRLDPFMFLGKKPAQDIGRQMFAHMLSPAQQARIAYLEEHAPQHTRAALREKVYRESAGSLIGMTWDTARFENPDSAYRFRPYDTLGDNLYSLNGDCPIGSIANDEAAKNAEIGMVNA